MGICVPGGNPEKRRRVHHAIGEGRKGSDGSVRADFEQRIRTRVRHHLPARQREQAVGIRVDFVARGVLVGLERTELRHQAPCAIGRRASELCQLGAVWPEHGFARGGIAAEADREHQIPAAMQREIVGTNGEHLSVFGGERRQSSDHVGDAAASNVVAADRPGLPVAARPFWARPARAIAATAGLRDVQRAFGPKRYAPWVIESADDDIPCRGSSGDERKPEAKSKHAEQ